MLRRFALLVFAATLPACAEPTIQPPATTTIATPATPKNPSPPASPASKQRVTFSQCNVPGPFISITFDDGPHSTQTPRLLKILKERGIKATFFVVGQNVAEYPEIAKQIVDEGHEIANHSWSHPLLTKLGEESVRDQIGRTHNVIRQTTGVTPSLFRPPYGGFTPNQRAWAHANWNYQCILWDVDSNDWKHRSATKTESTILASTRPGSIILCHDIHKSTIDGMPATLDGLLAKGFKFVTTSQLIAMHQEKATAAKTPPVKTLTIQDAANAPTSLQQLQPPPANP